MADNLTGTCGCGAVRFALSAPLLGAAYCHCTRCQRRTGGGSSLSALAAPGSFSITEGEGHVTTWVMEGGGFDKAFCDICGSGLYGSNPENRDQVVVRMGVLDGDPGIRPIAHQFVADAAVFEDIPDDGLPRFDERMPIPS